MVYKALASVIMGQVLTSAKKDVINIAKNQIIKSQQEGIRKVMLSHVAEKYTEEVEYNFSQYIKALSESNVSVEFKGKPGEALVLRAENAIKELEGYIEAQNPDGAVIQFLKKRYKEEGVRIISGKLYAGHYVNKRAQGQYEVLNRMGYAAAVDKRKPWLTGDKTAEGLSNMISEAAIEIFNVMFDDVDLSSEMANLNFSGAGEKIAGDSARAGKGGFADPTQMSKKKGRKSKR